MTYKRILRNQQLRFSILRFLSFVPDEWMIRLQYRIKTGRTLDLENPQRYSEKLQWYKLHYRHSLMTQCADKYGVREYVDSKGLKSILNRLYAVYSTTDEININSLPQKFVMKTTNGSGTNIFCTDKKQFNLNSAKRNLNKWMNRDTFSLGREWSYKGVTPRIVVEQYLEDEGNPYNGINDYKFICFNGEPKYIVLDVDRYFDHKRNIYDIDWNFIDVNTDHQNFGDCVPKPEKLDEMVSVAQTLAEDFPCVRVDLYLVKGKVYFGELTFYPWTGYVSFSPDDFDLILGSKFKLPLTELSND